jgi:hypothetical protein
MYPISGLSAAVGQFPGSGSNIYQFPHGDRIGADAMPIGAASGQKPQPRIWTPRQPYSFTTKTFNEKLLEPQGEWALENVFPMHSVNAIYGWSMVGKSFVTLDLMCSIALGRDWFGHETTQMGCLYFGLEGQEVFGNRQRACLIKYGLERFPENMDLREESFNLLDKSHVDGLIEQRLRLGRTGELIVFDTLSLAMLGADENSSTDMSKVYGEADRIKYELNATIALVHHSTKPDAKTGIAGDMRGSGVLTTHAAGKIQVYAQREQLENGQAGRIICRRIQMQKVRDDEDGYDKEFTLERVSVGQRRRKNGELVPITSCFVKPVEGNGADPEPWKRGHIPTSRPPLSQRQSDAMEATNGSNQQAIREAIVAVSIESRNAGQHGAPAGVHCAPREEVIERAVQIRNAPDPVQSKKNIKNAINKMLETHKLGSATEAKGAQWIWVN